MMRRLLACSTLALLSACGGAGGGGPAPASASKVIRPQLSACPAPGALDPKLTLRAAPVDLAAAGGGSGALASLVGSNNSYLAVSTTIGRTVCGDIRQMGAVNHLATHDRNRFVSYAWTGVEPHGYASDGTILVDRSGVGAQMDVGGTPVFSPSGSQFAVAHQSNNAFSALEGFAVWRVDPAGATKVAEVTDLPEMVDWRADGWSGEACVNLSAVRFSKVPLGGGTDTARLERERFVAQPYGGTWRVTKAAGNGCSAK